MGFPAIAALVAGAEVTGALALAAITEVGTVMTVVGAVTGSKDLMKAGAVMGLVGGVGGAIASSSTAGETALSETLSGGDGAFNAAKDSAAYDATAAKSALSDAVQGTGTTSFNEAAANAANDDALQGIIGSQRNAAGLEQPGILDTSASTSGQAAVPIQGATSISTDANAVTGAVTPDAPVTPASTDATAINTPGGSTNTNPLDQRLANGTATSPTSNSMMRVGLDGGIKKTSFWDDLSNFANKNSTLLKLGGTALSGLQSASQWDDRIGLEKQRMAYGNSVGNFAPTTPRPTGIIQSARTGAAS